MNSIINRVFHNNHVIFPLWVELSVGGIVHGWKCPGWDCLGWKCPWVGLSVGGSVLGGIVLCGIVRGWKCPGWKCPGGIVRGGSVLAPPKTVEFCVMVIDVILDGVTSELIFSTSTDLPYRSMKN